ncbi:MAG: hypothetical protein ACXITV_12365 [Luteibaculaceae bacterium]
MADIKFTGNRQLKNIAKDFTERYPYLYFRFYDQKGRWAAWESTHASIRAKKDAQELTATPNLQIGTFLKKYEDAFGVKIEIRYIKGEKRFKVKDEDLKLTINEYNKKVKELGAANALETADIFQ